MGYLHTARSLMHAGSISVVLGVLLAGTAARTANAKLPDNFGSPHGEPIRVVLTNPPLVPPPVNRTYLVKVIVKLEVVEKEMQTSERVSYTFWTFGGVIPGSFIRVRQGDTVEFHPKNHPSSKMPHNIGLHDVTGPDDGATSSFTTPGHESQFIPRALNEGTYIYHCATILVDMHIAGGMYGLILVELPEDLPKVDHKHYAMQSDFCTVGKYREKGLQPFDMEKAIDECPSYVLFNDAEDVPTGGKVLHAKVGETVHIFVNDSGLNLVSNLHMIGAIFDQVRYEGGANMQRNVQTTLISVGGATVVKFAARVPDSYVPVNHSTFRVSNKGATVIFKINEAENKLVYSGKELDLVYLGDRTAPNMSVVAKVVQASVSGTLTVQGQMQIGRALPAGTCSVCHQDNGAGPPGVFPSLAKSDFLVADPKRTMNVVLYDLNGKIKVNGQEYDSVMPSMTQLNGDEVANILIYVLDSWDNPDGRVNTEGVKKVRTRPTSAKIMVKHWAGLYNHIPPDLAHCYHVGDTGQCNRTQGHLYAVARRRL